MSGRPRLEFDLDQVRALAAMQCTQAEMAAVLKCSVDTIKRRIDEDADFADAINEGLGSGKVSLRRLQWEAAKKGNVTMMIWLGKQVLGQKDRSETEFRDITPLLIEPGDDTDDG